MVENEDSIQEKKYGNIGFFCAFGCFLSVLFLNIFKELEMSIQWKYEDLLFLIPFSSFFILFTAAFSFGMRALIEGETTLSILTIFVFIIDFFFF